MKIVFLVLLFIIGACLGSFLCCEARRLRLKETGAKPLGARSVCLSCKYRLKWYDNIPIVSWLILSGKCRKCGKKIGTLEFLSELLGGLFFLLPGMTFDLESTNPLIWITFIVTLLFIMILGFLAIYDGAYGELPSFALYLAILLSIIILALKDAEFLSTYPFSSELIYQPLLAILILAGTYLLLYLVSKGKWVGDGDYLMGLSIAIALGHSWLALVVLFLSNSIACLAILPAVKKLRHKKIHFGPFFVIAYVITVSFANFIISMI